MIKTILLIAILIAGDPVVSGQVQGSSRRLSDAKPRIEKLIAASGAEVVGLAVHDLQTNQSLFINERVSLHAASTMKLPVMMEVFRLAEAQKIGLRDPIEIKNQFASIVDGSSYSLNPQDDSDQVVYKQLGRQMPLIDLVDRMITWSSNLATNLLIEKVKAENVNKLMRELGANDIQVRRGVEDAKAFQAGLNNTTTAYDLMLLLKLIADNNFISPRARRQMVQILSAQHFNRGIPAGLPKTAKVAHKTGDITKHNHDAGIVYLGSPKGRKPYVIVVLTKGIADRQASSRLIAEISREVYLGVGR